MIVRGEHQKDFSIISNVGPNDERLSFAARGLLSYLVTKPKDWQVRVADLMRNGGKGGGKLGRDTTYVLLAELEAAGYLQRLRARDESGRMSKIEYVVFDHPQDEASPHPEYQDVDEPHPDLPDTVLPDTANQDAYKEHKDTKDRKGQRTEAADAAQPDLLGESKPEKPKRRSKHPMPKDFPSNADLDWARAHWRDKAAAGLVATDEFERFRNHHMARGSVFADWSAAWRTWAMNAVKFAAKDAPAGRSGGANSETDTWRVRLESFFTKNIWAVAWGPKPNQPGCAAPPELVREIEKQHGRSAA